MRKLILMLVVITMVVSLVGGLVIACRKYI